MESILASIAVGVVEFIIFGVIWKKKASPIRNALEVVVGSVKQMGAREVAKAVKGQLDEHPKTRKALDKIIKDAHAQIKVD